MTSIPVISPISVSQIQNKLIICTHFKIDQAVSRQYNNHMWSHVHILANSQCTQLCVHTALHCTFLTVHNQMSIDTFRKVLSYHDVEITHKHVLCT